MPPDRYWRSFREDGPAHFISRSYWDDRLRPMPTDGSVEGTGICGRVGLLLAPSDHYCGRCKRALELEAKRGDDSG